MTLPQECRPIVRLQDYVMRDVEVSRTCRQYDFRSAECFFIRWMYWWIPILAAVIIVSLIVCVCCLMKRRRNREYLKTREEEKKYRTSLVNGTVI